jgi:hypothetical protein
METLFMMALLLLFPAHQAKVKKYDKRKVIEKQQEEKLRLKTKFKKLQKKLVAEGKLDTNESLYNVKDNVEELERELGVSQMQMGSNSERSLERAGPSQRGPDSKQGRYQKQPTQIQRLAAKVEQEKEKARAAREEVARQRAEKQATFEAAQRERQRARHNHLMKTPKGQPLMKFRMQDILDVLEGKKKKR